MEFRPIKRLIKNSLRNRKVIIVLLSLVSLVILITSKKERLQAMETKAFAKLLKLSGVGDAVDAVHHEKDQVSKKEKNIIDSQKCKIPTLDPLDPDILPYLKKPFMQKCKLKQYGVVTNGVLRLKLKDVITVSLLYVNRVDDFHVKLSERHNLFGQHKEDSPPPKECWKSCGGKGGYCGKFCGEDGFCCRAGHPGCPSNISTSLMSKTSHTCVKPSPQTMESKECWNGCGKKGGHCPQFCGKDGYCCRVGHVGCPSNISVSLMSKGSHTCIGPKKSYGKGQDCDIVFQVTQQYFKLEILFKDEKHEEFHFAFLNKTETLGIGKRPRPKKTRHDEQLNIILLLFDSVSLMHTARSMQKTFKYLSEHPRSVLMRGHTIVGDGTTPQLTAMLTGKREADQPEARRGWKNSGFVDKWSFIFDDMHRKNYVTAYSEEEQWAGTFHYRLKGFDTIPTHHYTRPLWLAMRSVIYKQVSCSHQFHFKYLTEFFDQYKDYNKFAIVFNALLHNKMDRLENADEDTLSFYEKLENSIHGENTVVLLMGDHGLRTSSFRTTLQGKLEERLPLFAITLPPRFDLYHEEMKNLRHNSQLLTSHFDVYSTFQHLRTFPHLNEKVANKLGKSLFSDIGKLNRSCADAGVDKHWCTCLNYEKVDPTKDKYVVNIVTKVIDYINERNKQTVPGACAVLKLRNITVAGRRTPNAEVNQFKGTKTKSGECDSCDVQYDKSRKFSRYVYEINFVVSPSGGGYEAGGEVVHKQDGSVDVKFGTDISRTNLYGNQPKCVASEFPHLRAYCFCKDNNM